MFYGPVHSAEECATVLHEAVKVHLLEEVALSLAEIVGVEPSYGHTVKTVRVSGGQRSELTRSDVSLTYCKSLRIPVRLFFFNDQGVSSFSIQICLQQGAVCLQYHHTVVTV